MGSRSTGRYWTAWLVAAAIAGTAVVAAVALAPGPLTIRLPTSLESSSVGGATASLGALGVELSRAEVAFGDVAPGERSAPVDVRVSNTGAVPLAFRVSATPLANAEAGVEIPPDRVLFTLGDATAATTLGQSRELRGEPLAPGASLTVSFMLDAPGGEQGWLPAGDYAGLVTLVAEEVDLG